MIAICPRCWSWALVEGSDHFGTYRNCFMCGHVIEQKFASYVPIKEPRNSADVIGPRVEALTPVKTRQVGTLELVDAICRGGHKLLRRRADLGEPCGYGVGMFPCPERVRLVE